MTFTVSSGVIVQTAYKMKPPGFTFTAAWVRRDTCVSGRMPAPSIYLTSGFLRAAPRPVHGASTNTRSNLLFDTVSSTMTFALYSLHRCFNIVRFVEFISYAWSFFLFFVNDAIARLFPPLPAQKSKRESPRNAERYETS